MGAVDTAVTHSDDARRTARLAFAVELSQGTLDDAALDRSEVLNAFRPRPVPPRWRRLAERYAMKASALTYERHLLAPELAARRAVLGGGAAGTPRLLVRVDEFPDSSAYDNPTGRGLEPSRRFHAIMMEAGVPHLMAIVPQLTSRPTDPQATGHRPLGEAELEMIATMARDGVVFAQHGTTHRSRHSDPRRRSELCGLGREATGAVLDHGRAVLRGAGLAPRVFVAPFNRFDASQFGILAERFDVICAGPETVPLMGAHRGPQWRGAAVFLPCYPPLYGRAREILPVVQRLLEAQVGTWVPVTLHMGWEADDGWTALARLARVLAAYAVGWESFLVAVDCSR
jgi:hypothetical protein